MSEDIEKHVTERYEIYKKMGRGAYGIVWKARDKRTNKIVALKKVFEAFQNSVDAQRTYREVMYLQELNGHDNIVRLLSIIRAYNNKDLYLVFEYMETDLHTVIKAKILTNTHKKFIVYQVLKGLKYIHSAEIIHRDLKPSNLLIDSGCNIKIADFGLARSVATKADGQELTVSDYVATRWYRAPEILLGSQRYSKAVDIWSTGCILAELIYGKTLFAGKSTMNQIELIINLLGNPSQEDIDSVNSPLADNILESIHVEKTRSFTRMFGAIGGEGLDLLRKMLLFNPTERISVEESLNHPFFERFHCLEDEIDCKYVIRLPIDDNIKLSLQMYRDAIYKDISYKMKSAKSKMQKAKKESLPQIVQSSRGKNSPKDQITEKVSTKSTVKKRGEKRTKSKRSMRNKSMGGVMGSGLFTSEKTSVRTKKMSKVKSPEKKSKSGMYRYSSSKQFSGKTSAKNLKSDGLFSRKKSKYQKSSKHSGKVVKLYRSISPSAITTLFTKKNKHKSNKFFRSKKSLQNSSHYLLSEKSLKKLTQGYKLHRNKNFHHKKSTSYFNVEKELSKGGGGELKKVMNRKRYFYKSKGKHHKSSGSKHLMSNASYTKKKKAGMTNHHQD